MVTAGWCSSASRVNKRPVTDERFNQSQAIHSQSPDVRSSREIRLGRLLEPHTSAAPQRAACVARTTRWRPASCSTGSRARPGRWSRARSCRDRRRRHPAACSSGSHRGRSGCSRRRVSPRRNLSQSSFVSLTARSGSAGLQACRSRAGRPEGLRHIRDTSESLAPRTPLHPRSRLRQGYGGQALQRNLCEWRATHTTNRFECQSTTRR
jgi:hypothetical protein